MHSRYSVLVRHDEVVHHRFRDVSRILARPPDALGNIPQGYRHGCLIPEDKPGHLLTLFLKIFNLLNIDIGFLQVCCKKGGKAFIEYPDRML